MNDERNDGGPAYPTDNAHQNGPNTYHHEGMSLRDYFAGQRAAAMTPPAATNLYHKCRQWFGLSFQRSITNPEAEAAHCYTFADAMLAARKK